MKKYCIILLVFILSNSLLSQDKYFDRSYDFERTDVARGLLKINDEYIVAANVTDVSEPWDLLYAKFDIYGDSLILNHIENNTNTVVRKIFSNQEENIFVLGSEFTSPYHNAGVAEINVFSNDSLENTYTYQDSLDAISNFEDIERITEEKLVVAGIKRPDYTINDIYAYIACIDDFGTLFWDTIYTQHLNSGIWDISKTNEEGDFYTVGYVNRIDFPDMVSDGLLLKIDSTGTILWEQIIDFEEYEQLIDCVTTDDGGVLVSYRNIDSERKLIKFDALGNIEWMTDTLFTEGFPVSLHKTQNEDYLFVTTSFESSVVGRVFKIDTLGNVLWNRWYGGLDGNDYFYDLIQEEDGSLVMCGRKESGVADGADLWLVKTNCMGLFTEPQSEFTYEQSDSLTFTFENLSEFVYPDSIDGGHYYWDFGDGNLSEDIHPTHIYEAIGAYEVTLTAIVCQDTSIYKTCVYLEENSLCCAEVEAMPIPAFSLEEIDSLSISLENISDNLYEEFTNGASIHWDFGDGNTSTEFSPSHTFSEANYYDITLSVILCGDTTAVFETVKVGEPVGVESLYVDKVLVYPNPATTSITINYELGQRGETLFLYNSLGQLVQEVFLNPSLNSQTISLENFVDGIYYWQLENLNGKIVISR